MLNENKVAVISSGNGGQSFSAYMAMRGADVALYAREQERVDMFPSLTFTMCGNVEARAELSLISCDMEEVVRGARLIMVTTPSNYHSVVARGMAPYLEDGQIVVLNPGRTFGTYDFATVLREGGCRARIILAETDTLILTCRCDSPGICHIFHVKQNVQLAAHVPADTALALQVLSRWFDGLEAASSVFETGFQNIGMVFHPLPVLTNITRIEAKEEFPYYHGAITPLTASLMERLDAERVAVADAAGVKTLTATGWLGDRYGSTGGSLYDCIQNTESYAGILSPTTLDTRYVKEDVSTGCVPVACVGRALGVDTPVMDSVISWASAVYDYDFRGNGRNERRLGIDSLLEDLGKL